MEIDAFLALPPLLALTGAVQHGHRVWVCGPDSGEPAIMYGVDPTPGVPDVGVVWMMSTPLIHRHAYSFLERSREVVAELHEEFAILTNTVDARNVLHHRWLRWMGFSFLRKFDKWGARSVPFYEFARMKPCA